METLWSNFHGMTIKVDGINRTVTENDIMIGGTIHKVTSDYIKIDGVNKQISCYSNCSCDGSGYSPCDCNDDYCGCEGCDGSDTCSCEQFGCDGKCYGDSPCDGLCGGDDGTCPDGLCPEDVPCNCECEAVCHCECETNVTE